MRPDQAGRTGAGGKKAGPGIEGGAAVVKWLRRPLLGTPFLRGRRKVLRPRRALPGMQQFEARLWAALQKGREVQRDITLHSVLGTRPPGEEPGTGLAGGALRFRKELLDKLAVFETVLWRKR
jgi:hypothetical protein